MAELGASESSSDTDREFDPSAEMLVNDFDDERTLEEEEAMDSGGDSAGNELDDLQKEGDMPLEKLLSMYGYSDGSPIPSVIPPHETQSSSSEEILCKQDLTLDKDEIARDLLIDEENKSEQSSSPMDNECVVPDYIPSAAVLMLENSQSAAPDTSSSRLLRSVSHQSGYSGSESEDDDYIPVDDEDWRKTIQVGSDYQAVIPEGLCKYDDAPAYENEDKLLWDPSIINDKEVEDFLREAQLIRTSNHQGVNAIPTGNHCQDDEQTLYLLLQCGHNVEEALRRKRMQTVPLVDSMSLWSEEECRSFEIGLRTYGKDFHMIQQNKVKTRSVGELVYFYYLWKKTERHDMFANKTRLEKKKYALHPGTTDYMDRFLDDQENPQQSGHHKDRSSSPNIHSLIYGDHKRQNHNRTPTFGSSGSVNSASSPQQQQIDGGSSEMLPNLVHFTTAAPTIVPNLAPAMSLTTTTPTITNNSVLEQIASNLTSGLDNIEDRLESWAKLAAVSSSSTTTSTVASDFNSLGTSSITAAITSIANNNMTTKANHTNNSLSSQQAENFLNSIAMSVASVPSEGSPSIANINHDNNYQCSAATESAAH